MSENVFYLVPHDPEWQPSPEAATRTVALLGTMAEFPDQIDYAYHNRIQIFHPYVNWEGVSCPHCSADVEDWFHGILDVLYIDGAFSHLDGMTPCCNRPTSLNDLTFDWPCAFGRFAVRAENAGAVPDEAQMKALEAALGSKLTGVWQHL